MAEVINRVVVHSWSVLSEKIKTTSGVGMLQVRREHEFQDVVDSYLSPCEFEFWRLFRDRKQEYVSFLVCSLGIVRSPETIPDSIFTMKTSETLLLCLSLLFGLFIDYFRAW